MVQPKWPFKRVNVHIHSLLNGCFMVGVREEVWFKVVNYKISNGITLLFFINVEGKGR